MASALTAARTRVIRIGVVLLRGGMQIAPNAVYCLQTGRERIERSLPVLHNSGNERYSALPIRNTVALQTEHFPRVAGRPFFNMTC